LKHCLLQIACQSQKVLQGLTSIKGFNPRPGQTPSKTRPQSTGWEADLPDQTQGFMAGSGIRILRPSMDDPWKWLSAGWQDLWKAPAYSLSYGLAFTVIGLAITAGLYMSGLSSFVPAAAACFMLSGPLVATGLYEISRRHETGEALNWADIVRAPVRSKVQLGFLSFVLMFIVLVWIRAATLIYALFTYGVYLPIDQFAAFAVGTGQGLALITFGSLVGGVLAMITFSVAVLSIPILMRHDADAVTALVASVGTVVRWPGPMLLWAWLIAVMCLFGLATLFVGLVVVFPLLGHATWHAYRDLVRYEHENPAQ
jgi:uncharacterized membrane protein